MGALDGRVAVVTGAGRGLGRAHALFLAEEGAAVVVNDLDTAPADDTVAEIIDAGGAAVACCGDVSEWDTGRQLVAAAVGSFGRLDVLVNNAGQPHDRTIVRMTEQEWDDATRVNLKGAFVPTRWAAEHWRDEHKAGRMPSASIVNTTSTSGLFGNPGQSNYGAAKAGVAAFTLIAATELAPYGVRVNAVTPAAARTRLTEATPGLGDLVQPPTSGFDVWDPANVSPLVAYLATSDARETGRVFYVQGGQVRRFEGWSLGATIEQPGRWTVADLRAAMPDLAH